MHKNVYNASTSLLLYLTVFFLVGAIFGAIGWGLACGAILWAVLQIREIQKLQDWLQQGLVKELPESTGYWGSIFDELARIRKKQRRRERDRRDVIIRFQQTSAALPDAVVIINAQRNLEWWNRAAERLLGLKVKSDQGKPVFNLLRDPRFIRYIRREDYAEPLYLNSPHNTETKLEYTVTEFAKSDLLLVARDISQVTRLEQTRQDFVANASHELRTPLTVIRGYLETFLDQDLAPPLHRALGQMQLQSNRMESLVEDLLLLSKLDSSEYSSEEYPLNMALTLQSIVRSAEQLGRDKDQKISIDCDQQVELLGHEKELYSAFSNLIYNAVRYTQAKGVITIRWWQDAQGGHFEVQDNGPGIDSIHLDRLTERFYRVDDDRSAVTGGTGLGLAIVKHVLNRHSAQLQIESKLGVGSTFSCHFAREKLQIVSSN